MFYGSEIKTTLKEDKSRLEAYGMRIWWRMMKVNVGMAEHDEGECGYGRA